MRVFPASPVCFAEMGYCELRSLLAVVWGSIRRRLKSTAEIQLRRNSHLPHLEEQKLSEGTGSPVREN